MRTMGNVPDKAGREMTMGSRHRFSALDRAFRYQKAASKRLYQAQIIDLRQEINRLRWSDPYSGMPAIKRFRSSLCAPSTRV